MLPPAIKARKFAAVAIASLATAACASLANRPTADMVAAELSKSRKIVQVRVSGSSAALANQLEAKGKLCTGSDVRASSVASSGTGYVRVSSTVRQRIDRGSGTDGSLWLALRMDGILHAVAFGVSLQASADGRIDAKAFPADSRKVPEITAAIESGNLFCMWRDFSYPYD